MPLFQTVTDFHAGAEILRRRRYGVVETVGGRFCRVRLRPWPKLVSLPEIRLADWWTHGRGKEAGGRKQEAGNLRTADCELPTADFNADRCWLYYNQPWRFSNFLSVVYVVSTAGTSYRTFHRAVATLDEIARIKRSDALLCDLSNQRISDRLMRRWGWEPHAPRRGHRNYIKRFYGAYPRVQGSGFGVQDSAAELAPTFES